MEDTKKRNCICLSCTSLDYFEYIENKVVKCTYQIDSDEPVSDTLLKGEADKCPIDAYVKQHDSTGEFLASIPVTAEYVPSAFPLPERKPAYECPGCKHWVYHSCPAFPEGIPCAIIHQIGHKEKLPGQNTDLVCDWDDDKYLKWIDYDWEDDLKEYLKEE